MRLKYLPVILVIIGLVVSAPIMSLAQSGLPAPNQATPPPLAKQAPPQLKGGVATVIGVDQPDNCLRVRSGPGSSYDVIGCIAMGTQVDITGVWTSNNWAQVTGNGWVYGPQIATDLRPPQATLSQSAGYGAGYLPIEDYAVDWDYLPDYGYATYWYSGIPIICYNVGIWWRYHPWWWWNRRHVHDPFRHWAWNRATGINRNLVNSNLNRTLRANTAALNRNAVTNRSNLNRNFTTNQSNLNRTSRTLRSNTTNLNLNRAYTGSLNRANTMRSYSVPQTSTIRSYSVRSPSMSVRSAPHFSGGGRRR